MQSVWTDKKIEKLKKLWDKGLSTSEIGKKLNVSKNSVVGKVHRLGLPQRGAGNTKVSTVSKKTTKDSKHLFGLSFGKKTSAKEKVVKNKTTVTEVSSKVKNSKKEIESIEEKIVVKKTKVESKSNTDKKHYKLSELKPNMCRWPEGEPNSPEFHFCGEEVFKNRPYCLKHCADAYTTTSSKGSMNRRIKKKEN